MKILALIADRVLPAITGTRVRNLHLWPAMAKEGHEVRLLGLDLQAQSSSPASGPPGIDAQFVRPQRAGLLRRLIGASTRSHHQWPRARELAEAVDQCIEHC